MKTPAFTKQFERDIKLCKKRQKDITKIKAIMFDLIVENPLPPKNKDHALSGNWKDHSSGNHCT